MKTICGADCGKCPFREGCRGCAETCGRPFGGTCVAAEYIRAGGMERYREFKRILLDEVNALLKSNELPPADGLNELAGSYVNLAYPLPSGDAVRFLDDKKIYLGTQIELADQEICCGVVADTTFILICRYGENGSEPELIAFKRR